MNFAITIIGFGLGLMFLYGVGIFALCLQAGESLLSAAIEASAWCAAFSVSHFLVIWHSPRAESEFHKQQRPENSSGHCAE
jgi:hypothetical protein